jgi:methyl acetate hydrolase
LEEYFRRNVTGPLRMNDTAFRIPADKFERMASRFTRQNAKATLQEIPRKLPGPPQSFSGGGGLYGTAPDFVRFMQMILRRGQSQSGTLLKPESVEQMSRNQIGELAAGKLKTLRPEIASDTDFHPGFVDKFGLGFLINTTAYAGGRSAGSLAWAGIDNTFFWIDPQRRICATLMLQYLPFCDKEAIGLLGDFERAVYLGMGREALRANS